MAFPKLIDIDPPIVDIVVVVVVVVVVVIVVVVVVVFVVFAVEFASLHQHRPKLP